MRKDTEFEEFGRKTSYKVPEGFFEKVSETTLLKAKQREHKDRVIRKTLRVMAMAASLTAIALLGYFMLNQDNSRVQLTDQRNQTETKQNVSADNNRPTTETTQTPETTEKKQSKETKETSGIKETKETNKVIQTETDIQAGKPEEITAILTELSDDELLQLAAVYKSDPFIEELEN